jgi:predicted RNA binding protein YcfA (HicA-like mRNA interferase family)
VPKLNPLAFSRFEGFLKYVGCTFIRQKGSHCIYQRPGLIRPIVVPYHCKEVPVYIIKNTLRILKIDIDNFLNIIEQL